MAVGLEDRHTGYLVTGNTAKGSSFLAQKQSRNQLAFSPLAQFLDCANGFFTEPVAFAKVHRAVPTCLDGPFNPLARFYPLGSYTPTVPCN